MTWRVCWALGLVATVASTSVWAQIVAPGPGVTSPTFQRREFEPAREPLAEPVPGEPVAEPVAPGVIEGDGFVLGGILLEGATVLDEAELQPLWQPLLGQEVGLSTLDELAGQITAAHRARGFVLTQAIVPAQTIGADRVVRIQVIEGFVDRVTASGGDASSQAIAERLLDPVGADRPLRLGTLERGVLLARDTLGGSVETVLQPSPTAFGAADLEVVLAPKPVSGFAIIDNRASRLLGPWIARAGVGLTNTLGLGERFEVQGAASLDTPRLWFGEVSGLFPVAALDGTWFDGATFRLRGDIIRAKPDLDELFVDDFTSVQDEFNIGGEVRVPFVRSRASNVFGSLGINWRDSTSETTFFGTGLGSQTDRLLTITPRVTFDRADQLAGITEVDAELRQGVSIDDVTTVSTQGPGAPVEDFTAISGSVQRLQRLGDAGWSALGRFVWQYGMTALPVSERFSLGGEALGRGFAPGNTTGDSGYGVRLEVRRAIELPPVQGQPVDVQVYGFGDYGSAIDRSNRRDGAKWEVLGSMGLGARIDLSNAVTITPELVQQVAGEPVDTAGAELETRFLIGAVARF